MVYIDEANIPYRGMLMCHMIADTPKELREMAGQIGVAERHVQFAGTRKEHFDVCRKMRARAIALGAVPVSTREIVRIQRRKPS